MRRGPTLAEYLAAPQDFPEIEMTGSTMPRGRRVAAPESLLSRGARMQRGGSGAPATRYERAAPVLPPMPVPRDLPRQPRYAVEPMRKPGFPMGPGGVLTAPPTPPDSYAATPAPTHYRSMQEAQLADAMMMQPIQPLPDSLAPMPALSGYASGTQSNGMRVPPAPASFGDNATTPGMGLFGKRPGALTDENWARALESARVAGGKQEQTPADLLFAAIIGGRGTGNARR